MSHISSAQESYNANSYQADNVGKKISLPSEKVLLNSTGPERKENIQSRNKRAS
jgi:hypothetical protein